MSKPPQPRAPLECADRPDTALSVLQSTEFLTELTPHLQFAAVALGAEFAVIKAPEVEFSYVHGEPAAETQWQLAMQLENSRIDYASQTWRLTRTGCFGLTALTLGGCENARAPLERDCQLMHLAVDAIERQFYWVLQKLQAQRELLRLHKAIDAVEAGVWQINFGLDQFRADANAARVLGITAVSEAKLADFLERVYPEDQALVRSALDRSLQSGQAERIFFRAKASERWLSAGFVCERDGEHGGKLIGLMRDYHRQKAAEVELEQHQLQLESLVKQLRSNNRIDPLTGIANRVALDERLSTEVLRARRKNECLAIFMIDVDHFKSFNDNFGHINGDAALKQTANSIVAALPKGALAVRFGGEEFCAMAAIEPDLALELAERLRTAVQNASWELRPITVSIGFCCMRGVEIDQALLLQRADAALYRAKAEGRNRVAGSASTCN